MKFTKLSIRISILLLGLTLASSASAAITLRPALNLGLVGYWSMNEGAGTKAGDSSGNGNTGDITGASWADGKRGKALSFNGTSDYVDAGDPTSGVLDMGTSDMTLSAWIKPNSATSQIINKRNYSLEVGYDFYFDTNQNVTARIGDGDGELYASSANNSVPLSQWSYVAAVYDRDGNLTMYVNGISSGTPTDITSKSSSQSNSHNFTIGDRNQASYHQFFDGLVDEVRIYNRALSATEVSSLYQSGSAKFLMPDNKDLVGYWAMEEGTGTQAGDSSGNGNAGTLSGSTLPDWTDGKRGKALDFDGASSYVNMSSLSSSNFPTITVSAWFKAISLPSASNTRRAVAVGSNDAWIGIDDSGNISSNIYDGTNHTISSSGTNYLDTWVHVTVTSNGTTERLYVNGTEADYVSAGNMNWESAFRAKIGAEDGLTSPYFFDGLIDEVRIYNRALGATEVASLYNSSGKRAEINSSQNSRMTDGLVGLWSFNGPDVNMATNTAYDRAGTNNGTISGATQAIGKVGQALSFDNTNFVNMGNPSSLRLVSSFTLSAWVKTSAIDDDDIISRSGFGSTGYLLNINYVDFSSNKFACVVSSDGASAAIRYSASTPVNTTWYYVTCVYNAAAQTLDLYVNSALDNGTLTGTVPASVYDNSANFNIGRRSDGSNYFSGAIDEVRVYNRALSAGEVQELYNMSVPAFRCGDPLVDSRDNKAYATVQIGTQCWMKQGLNVGTRIAGGTTQDGYSGTTCTSIDKWCYSDTDANCDSNLNPNYPDGGLYQWNQAMCGSTTEGVQGICPTGWHLPTDAEICTLEQTADSSISCSATGARGTDGGTKLKPGGSSGWEGNLAGDYYVSTFINRASYGIFWSSSEYDASNTWRRYLGSGDATVYRDYDYKTSGFTIRCLKN